MLCKYKLADLSEIHVVICWAQDTRVKLQRQRAGSVGSFKSPSPVSHRSLESNHPVQLDILPVHDEERNNFNSFNWCSPDLVLREPDSGSSGAKCYCLVCPLVVAGGQQVDSLFTLFGPEIATELCLSWLCLAHSFLRGTLGLTSACSSSFFGVTGRDFSGSCCVLPKELEAAHTKASCPLCRISNPGAEEEDVTQKRRAFGRALSSCPS